MFDIGFTELMLVAVLGLIILGPERLPKAARTVGLMIGRIRRTMSSIQQEIEQEVRNQEIREKLKDPLRTYTDQDQSAASDTLDDFSDHHADQHTSNNDMSVDDQIEAMHAHHPKEDPQPSAADSGADLKDRVQQDK